MGKKATFSFGTDHKLWEDLEQYLAFCVEYGHKWDPATLGDNKSASYRQFVRHNDGKPVKNIWEEDAKIMNSYFAE